MHQWFCVSIWKAVSKSCVVVALMAAVEWWYKGGVNYGEKSGCSLCCEWQEFHHEGEQRDWHVFGYAVHALRYIVLSLT